MGNPSENTKAIRPLSSSEAEAVCGGFIGETVRNDSPPPPSMSETRSNNSGPCLPWTTETTDRTGRSGAYCMTLE
jgi:hypothetical protein